jgi:hypothetical protein
MFVVCPSTTAHDFSHVDNVEEVKLRACGDRDHPGSVSARGSDGISKRMLLAFITDSGK